MSDYPIDTGLGDPNETCARHPREPARGCRGCEAEAESQQDARAAAPGDQNVADERLHERWLDRIGGSR